MAESSTRKTPDLTGTTPPNGTPTAKMASPLELADLKADLLALQDEVLSKTPPSIRSHQLSILQQLEFFLKTIQRQEDVQHERLSLQEAFQQERNAYQARLQSMWEERVKDWANQVADLKAELVMLKGEALCVKAQNSPSSLGQK